MIKTFAFAVTHHVASNGSTRSLPFSRLHSLSVDAGALFSSLYSLWKNNHVDLMSSIPITVANAGSVAPIAMPSTKWSIRSLRCQATGWECCLSIQTPIWTVSICQCGERYLSLWTQLINRKSLSLAVRQRLLTANKRLCMLQVGSMGSELASSIFPKCNTVWSEQSFNENLRVNGLRHVLIWLTSSLTDIRHAAYGHVKCQWREP